MSRVSLSYAVISAQDRRHHQRCCFTSLENGKPLGQITAVTNQAQLTVCVYFLNQVSSAGVLASLMWMKWRLFIRMRMTALHAWEAKLWESWLMLSALNTAVFQKDLIFLHLFCLCVRNSMRHLFTVGGAARFTSRADSIIDPNGLCLLLPRHRR